MLVSEQELKAACHAASTSWTLSGDQVYRLYKEVESNLSPSPRAQALEDLFDAVTLMQKHDEKFEGEIPLATIQKVYTAHAEVLRAKEASKP
ncbi:hypothetical protein RI570_17545 [Brucella pseudogrignonensis]|uniref:hypothetical protein n=1 Tax=Brucella pseudogrignonensis TaxID=419475 RepID=UPI0028B541D5|nr:hypothetical protein [Brucella pseudogrignonensis]MDT6941910.1 hypothetical protein [Brucella pseudogrignonensis]